MISTNCRQQMPIKFIYSKEATKNSIYQSHCTGIPRFTLLMWGRIKKKRGSENRVNGGELVVLKGRKIEYNYILR